MRYIQGVDRKRKIAFPQYIDDYVTDDNPVRVIDAFVKSIDIVKLEFKNAVPSDTGRPGYDPRDIIKLYLYGYMNKTISSRKLEAETMKNIEVM